MQRALRAATYWNVPARYERAASALLTLLQTRDAEREERGAAGKSGAQGATFDLQRALMPSSPITTMCSGWNMRRSLL